MTFWSFFSTLPEPAQTLLLGAAGDFLGGLASSIVGRLLEKLGYQARKRLRPEPKQVATNQAMAQALYKTFSKITDEPEGVDHYLYMFNEWTKREAVAGELSQLLDPRPRAELDLVLLVNEFEDLGYDPDLLGEGILFEDLVRDFSREFYDAAAAQPELQGAIEIGLLRGMVERLDAVVVSTGRIALAAEGMAQDVSYIKQVLQQIIKGNATSEELQEAIRMTIQQGFTKQHLVLEAIATTLQRIGYDVGFNQGGEVTIYGGPRRTNSQFDPDVVVELQREITLLRQAIEEHTPTDDELDVLEIRYRQHVVDWFENLTFQGMMRTARVISLPLEDVYVELRAVAEIPESTDTFSAEERRLLLEMDQMDLHARQELLGQLDVLRRERWSQTLPERKPIVEAVCSSERHAFVVLGDPGSGKTTLLHFLALLHAAGKDPTKKALGEAGIKSNRLPIFVPLAAFDDMLQQTPELTLLEFLTRYYERRRLLPGLAPLFQRALEAGQALLLLDGLDEILSTTTRKYVTQQVSALINLYAKNKTQIVVTSRFVGYREAPLPGNVAHLSVIDFGQPEIEAFVHQWAHALERSLVKGTETRESIRRARRLETDLLRDVRSNASVRRLAANPLMLTMLALVRRQVGQLPHRRILLYARYVDTLIESWIEARSHGERIQGVDTLELHEVESILIPLSLWLQCTKPSGTASRRQIQSKLRDIYLQKAGIEPVQATASDVEIADGKARRFLSEMHHMTGLIVERGYDAFGFLHLTFQEYMVGRALAQLDDESRWQETKLHLHDPRWQEPILLCCGRLGVVEGHQSQVTAFVRRILDHRDETEQYLRRNLLLALTIAADDVQLSPALLKDLSQKVRDCHPVYSHELARQLIRRVAQIAEAGNTSLVETLDPALKSPSPRLQTILCETLAQFLTIPEVPDLLMARLSYEDSDVRKAAVKALAGLVESNAGVRNRVAGRLYDGYVRETVISVLAGFAGSDEKIHKGIVNSLSNRWSDVRRAALRALVPLAESDQDTHNHVLELFQDEDSWVRRDAAEALAGLVLTNVNLRKKITSYLNSEDERVRESAVRTLVSLVGTDEVIRDSVVTSTNDESDDVRNAAIQTLAQLVVVDSNVRDLFIAHLDDDACQVRWSALEGLAQIVTSDREVRQRIITCLTDEEDDYLRRDAIEALATIVNADEQVRDQIVICLQDRESHVRRAAVKALQNVSEQEPVQEALRKALGSDDWQTRQDVAQVLGDTLKTASAFEWLNSSLEQQEKEDASAQLLAKGLPMLSSFLETNKGVRELAIECLFDENHWVGVGAVEALSDVSRADSEVRDLLIARFQASSFTTRQRLGRIRPKIVSVLALQAQTDEKVRNLMIDSLEDENDEVRRVAMESLAEMAESDGTIHDLIVTHLKHDWLRSAWGIPESLVIVAENDEEIHNLILARLDECPKEPRRSRKRSLLRALPRLVRSSDEILKRLILLLKNGDEAMRGDVLEVLTDQASLGEEVRDLAIGCLQDTSTYVRVRAIESLSGLVDSDTEVCKRLKPCLAHWDEHTRKAAVSVLGKLAGSDSEVRAKLITCAGDKDEVSEIRAVALSNLAMLVESDPQVRELTISCINDSWAEVRIVAVNALAPLIETKDIRDKIIERLEYDWWGVRAAAVTSLLHWTDLPASAWWHSVVNWLCADIDFNSLAPLKSWQEQWIRIENHLPTLVGRCLPQDDALCHTVHGWLDEPSMTTRLGAVRALVQWPEGPPPETMPRILKALQDKRGLESYPARITAASFLLNHHKVEFSRNALSVCLDALTYGTSPWDYLPRSAEIRKQAVLVLAGLEPIHYDEEAYDKLLSIMQTDDDPEVRDAAYVALVRLAHMKEQIKV